MTHRHPAIAAACSLLATALGPGAAAQFFEEESDPPPATELVSARLTSEHAALRPGGETAIGLTFEIEPDWHMYWRNSGDTGMGPVISFDAPEGVEIGDLRWPAPKRYVHGGGLLDYIYEQRVTLIAPVELSGDLTGRDEVTISADIQFLVCKEVCLAGQTSVERSFPIGTPDEPPSLSDNAPLFKEARKRLPRSPGVEMAVPVVTNWRGATLHLKSPGAERLVFFPINPPLAVNLAETGEAEADSLSITYEPKALAKVDTVHAVVETVENGRSKIYSVRVNPPKTADR